MLQISKGQLDLRINFVSVESKDIKTNNIIVNLNENMEIRTYKIHQQNELVVFHSLSILTNSVYSFHWIYNIYYNIILSGNLPNE